MLTNVRLATASYALSAAGASGFSLMVLSYALSSPQDFAAPQGTVTLCITNDSTTAPIHVELRSIWTGFNGVSQTTPVIHALTSNAQTYGGSALQNQQQTLLVSGQGAVLPFTYVVGSGIQVWLIAASSIADAAGCSGQVGLWGV